MRLLILSLAFFVSLWPMLASGQQVRTAGKRILVSNPEIQVIIDPETGKVAYHFSSGTRFEQTTAYAEDVDRGLFTSGGFRKHRFSSEEVHDTLGKGVRISFVHEDETQPVRLTQYITLYQSQPFLLLSVELKAAREGERVETRNISPLCILPVDRGGVRVPGENVLFTDYPFDNDNWVDVVSRQWPQDGQPLSGISYELASAYDAASKKGFVVGSLVHEFWKTGIRYGTARTAGKIDSLIVFGGVSTKDNPALPDSFGGKDGTHDYVLHGTQVGVSVSSPLIYLAASADVRHDLLGFGNTVRQLSGSRQWKGAPPFYWNSFGVEGVLGHQKIMMPGDVAKISDFIHSLDNFNQSTKPVLSIDSYDQTIYSTEVLKAVSRYGKKKGQQMGFYFIPFSLWTWKNQIQEAKLTGTDYLLRDVILRDEQGNYIPYKDGDWGAFPIDPTHPGTRAFIIGQLLKAKAIDARFIKIDFLSAGALESATRFDRSVRSGIQAYNYGMRMLRHLTDSILGPDIFITQAISPLFPHQYAHTRFLSTDVYSHLRNDLPGFPHYGSTCASVISGSHFWWTQGTLWPYTNLDVSVMEKFQKNAPISEQDLKVRLYSMIALGSLLGDGSDYRRETAAERARKYLNHPTLCAFFSRPRAFFPHRFPVGTKQDQQVSFFLPGDTLLFSAFNFDLAKPFTETFYRKDVKWKDGAYVLSDFLTGQVVGRMEKGQDSVQISVQPGDALLLIGTPVRGKNDDSTK